MLYRKYSKREAEGIIEDSHQVEDVVQDTFLKLYRIRERLDLSDPVGTKALVRIVTRQKALDHVRGNLARERRRKELLENLYKAENREKSTESKVLRKEEHRKLQKILYRLKRKNRISYEGLIRCIYHEESPKEVAKDLGISVNNLYVHISRARHYVKTQFKEEKKPD